MCIYLLEDPILSSRVKTVKNTFVTENSNSDCKNNSDKGLNLPLAIRTVTLSFIYKILFANDKTPLISDH